MKSSNPINALSHAIHAACLRDLQDFEYAYRSPLDKSKETKIKTRRPDEHNLGRVWLFCQMWGSTALGFGGMGCASMTTAETVIVEGPSHDCCVYFGTRFAYRVASPNQAFWDDVKNWRMVEVSGKSKYNK